MTVRNLDRLFQPRSIALIGASRTGELWGTVLAENTAMLGLARKLGFKVEHLQEEPGALRVIKSLGS